MNTAPDPLLWHYTSVSKLDMILASGEVWASHADHLNDPRERRSIYSIFEQEPGALGTSLKWWHEDEQIMYTLAPFVFSLSSEDDNLLLWRAYADQLHGVAIGFRSSQLLKSTPQAVSASLTDWRGSSAIANFHKPTIVKVTYGEEEVRKEVNRVADELTHAQQQLEDQPPIMTNESNLLAMQAEKLFGDLNYVAANYKTQGWSQEAEVRLVTRMSSGAEIVSDPANRNAIFSNWEWRSHRPFCRLSLPDLDAIEQVVVGPLGDEFQVRSTVNHYHSQTEIRKSPTLVRCGFER